MTQSLPVIQPSGGASAGKQGDAGKQAARCRQLLSKGLYINAGLPKGEEIAGDGNFWCGKTQTVFGPDTGLCNGDLCRNEARSCYDA